MINMLMPFISIYIDLPRMLLDYGSQVNEGGEAWVAIGLIVLMMLAVYGLTILIIKFMLIDNLFPFLFIRDSIRNRIRVARIIYGSRNGKLSRLKNADTLHIKTSFMPLFETLPVNVGDNKIRYKWWRSYNIENNEIKQIVWDDDAKTFRIQYETLTLDGETLDDYIIDSKRELKNVAVGVSQGIRGDFNLQKDRYYLSIPHPLDEEEGNETMNPKEPHSRPAREISIKEYQSLSEEDRKRIHGTHDVVIRG